MTEEEKQMFINYTKERNPSKKKKREEELFNYYYPWMVGMSFNVASSLGNKISPEELQSYAWEPLLNKIKTFDPYKNVTFKTYCTKRVYGSMIDYVRKVDHISRSVRCRYKEYGTAEQKLKLLNVFVDDKMILNELGWDIKDFYKKRNKYIPPNKHYINENTDEIEQELFHPYQPFTEDKDTLQNMEEIQKLYDRLIDITVFDQREQYIIYSLYINNKERKQIHKELNLTETRLSQIINNIKIKIKKIG